MMLGDEYMSYLLARILHLFVVNTSRSTSGSFSQGTRTFDCINPNLGTEGMSMLSQIILEILIFLISRSWHRVNAVLSVLRVSFGAFSCQKRSPSRRRWNPFAIRHCAVGPKSPPLTISGSNIAVNGKIVNIIRDSGVV